MRYSITLSNNLIFLFLQDSVIKRGYTLINASQAYELSYQEQQEIPRSIEQALLDYLILETTMYNNLNSKLFPFLTADWIKERLALIKLSQ